MSSFARQQLEDWLGKIDVKADSVLDIGGSQLPVKGRTKSWDVKNYKILDLEMPHHEKQKPDVVCDMNKKPASFYFTGQNYDVCFCLEVMEYIFNPLQCLQNIYDFLAPGGILYISFPFVYPLHPPTGTDYLRYTKYGAEKLLREAGFSVDECFAKKAIGYAGGGPLFDYWIKEGMRYDKSENMQALVEIGYCIKAIKI